MIYRNLRDNIIITFRFLRINSIKAILPFVSGCIMYYVGYYWIWIFWLKLLLMLFGVYLIIHGAVFLGLSFALRRDIDTLKRISKLETLKKYAMEGDIEIFKQLDEDELIDRKRERIQSGKLIKLLAAMANRFGGVIVFGIDDNKELFLLNSNERDSISNQIENICDDRIVPSIKPEPISISQKDDLGILTVFIPRTKTKPVRTKNDNICYHRVGRSNRRMLEEEIRKFRKLRF